MSGADFPNLLIVSDSPFSRVQGLGVQLVNFFEGWPRDNLALLYSAWSPTSSMPRIIGRCRFEEPFRSPGPGGRMDWVRFCCGSAPAWRGRVSGRWHRRWLGNWKPRLTLAYLLDPNSLIYADRIAGLFDTPLAVQITDDLQSNDSTRGLDGAVLRAIRNATVRISNSEEMSLSYRDRFGFNFIPFHNGASAAFAKAAQYAEPPRTVPVLRYLGGVKPIQHGALRTLASMASAAKFRLEIYGSWDEGLSRSFVDGDWTYFGGLVTDTERLLQLMGSADFLLNPVVFDHSIAEASGLSFPVKLIEGLSSGTPVLAYGPLDSAPVRFCAKHDVGWIIGDELASSVDAMIARYRREPAVFREKALKEQARVLRDFNIVSIRNRFQRLMADAAGNVA